MTIFSVLSWILCGLVVGLVARVLVPGRQDMTWLMTAVLGIAGAILGGIVYMLVPGTSHEPFSTFANAWQGWLVSIIGAMIVLWGYVALYPRGWRP